MSILSRFDPALLRRVAASLVSRSSEFADLFLEIASQVTVARGPEGAATTIVGRAEGAAARRIGPDRVRHAAVAGLDAESIAALPGRLEAGSPPVAAAPRERRRIDRLRGLSGDASGEAVRAVGEYLAEVEAAALAGAPGGAGFQARAEIHGQSVAIATSEGDVAEDRRDWVAFSARMSESGGAGPTVTVSEGGGARDPARLRALHPPAAVGDRLAQALLEQRSAAPPPSGETTIVLAPGPGGIFFHEACGHALEADRALRGRSAFMELLGESIGPGDLTLVDDPTLTGLPGSRRVDDEGWPAGRNVLIESGRLVGLLLDRATALLAGTAPTGSARRESYRDLPMPRMTNTFIMEGPCAPEEILASVGRGLYITELGGGAVDTVTADFSFRVRRGFLVAGGRAVAPIAPAEISGNGVDAMRGIAMIGSDLRFDSGAGECGKEGQRTRAAVGQPTIKVTGLSVRPAEAW